MPDVQAKLDEAHVDLLVQPEFFVNDVVAPGVMWAPDTLKGSGYNDVLRMPSVKAMVLPEVTGNIFNFSADAQSHFAVKPGRREVPRGHLVGQPDAPGLVASPWVVPDPLRPGEPIRRAARAAGRGGQWRWRPARASRAPTPPSRRRARTGTWRACSGATCRWARRRASSASAGRSRARGSAGRGALTRSRAPQRNVALASRGRRVVAAWEERRGGRDRVFVAGVATRGRSWAQGAGGGGWEGRAAVARRWRSTRAAA